MVSRSLLLTALLPYCLRCHSHISKYLIFSPSLCELYLPVYLCSTVP